MRFTNGYWLDREGFTVERARGVYRLTVTPGAEGSGGAGGAEGPASAATGPVVTVLAPVRPVASRGDTLNNPALTVSYEAVADGVIRVTAVNHRGTRRRGPELDLTVDPAYRGTVTTADDGAEVTLHAGDLAVTLRQGQEWRAEFSSGSQDVGRRVLTASLPRSLAHVVGPDGTHYMHEQLALAPGERVYGLGERFGALTKNGQSVDIWNEDGGTSSEQAYKNIPFYLSSAGYGVLVDNPGGVSFEVGSEMVTRTQFSVEGQEISYLLIDGPTPKDVLRRYTALTGRPPMVPTWSLGLWLSTSFTTDYDEATVTSFIDGMAERDIPLSVFHFDCFWMRGFHWSDFQWDPDTFPDPEGLLARLHERGLRVCVWINPYIAQSSRLFGEGMDRGYLVRRSNGDVWQTDLWQAGMALVDFTNPDAVAWYRGHLAELLDMGVDCFKTDFGERIPVRDIVWSDGSDPERMHNYYTHLYNRAVFELLTERRGEGEAVLFARSATAGGQQFPVHWGGDCESTYASMGESLRGGLSLAASGFGFWSHDIGGFEGQPDAGVFKRWLAFGLLSSHSRLHGSTSYRVPWAFDEEAVEVARELTALKLSLMPYLYGAVTEAHTQGVPVMRPMVVEFPEDRGAREVDTQYMLGPSLLVAPVMDADGEVDVYLPAGEWTSWWDGSTVVGPRWVRERHDVHTLPLYQRPGSVVAVAAEPSRPEEDWVDRLTLRAGAGWVDGEARVVEVPGHDGHAAATWTVSREGGELVARNDQVRAPWALEHAGQRVEAGAGESELRLALR